MTHADDAARTTPEDVLGFWFGPAGGSPLQQSAKWYTKDPAFDAECRARFERAVAEAGAGAFDAWRATPRGRLALVLLLDQLPRNIHRGTPEAFAFGARAQAVVREALRAGDERVLDAIERTFLYMPLMHAEDLETQRASVDAFERLLAEAPPALQSYVVNGLDFARRHEAIVARFGRFPHRNAILGRTSTPEEIEFLRLPGSSF